MTFLSAVAFAEQYLSQHDFLQQSLGENAKNKVLWINADLRQQLKTTYQTDFTSARVRYWEEENKRAYILDEIGRDEPITMGFIIEKNKIIQMRILEYRESRGYEVRYPRFTQQFSALSLNEKQQLDGYIDNITGATLSVNAVKKAALIALYLNQQVELGTSKEK